MGMNADGYTVDEDGNFNRVDDTGGDDYDVLYTKKDYDQAKKSGNTNSDGNPEPEKQVVVNDTELLPQLESKENVAEAMVNGTMEKSYVANTTNRSDAYNVFKFAAENTTVEVGYQRYTDNTLSLSISDSDTDSAVIPGTFHSSNKGKVVAADIHSHPGTTPSDLRPSDTDYYRARSFKRKNTSAKVQLYMPKAPNSNARWLDLVNNKWIIK